MVDIPEDERVAGVVEEIDKGLGETSKHTSKTLVIGIFSIIAIILQHVGYVGGAEYIFYEALAIAVAMVVLRIITKEPVDILGFITTIGGLLRKKP